MNIRLTPVVKNLMIINGIVFLLMFFPFPFSRLLEAYLPLYKSNLLGFRGEGFPDFFMPYQIVTSFFTHTALFHILFNMLALLFIGVPIENGMGSKRFLKFYLFCGVVSGIIVAFLDPSPNPILGASTAISGILAAFGIMYPTAPISLFFLPPIEARKIFLGAAVLSAFLTLLQLTGEVDGGGISHFGHLAGMLAGAFFFYLEKHIPFLRN